MQVSELTIYRVVMVLNDSALKAKRWAQVSQPPATAIVALGNSFGWYNVSNSGIYRAVVKRSRGSSYSAAEDIRESANEAAMELWLNP